MTIKSSLLNWKLRYKIILHILVVGGLATFILAALYLTTRNDITKNFLREKFELVATMIECNITHLMHQDDSFTAIPVLQRIVERNKIDRIRILDLDGNILHSSIVAEKDSQTNSDLKNKLGLLYQDSQDPEYYQPKSVSSEVSLYAVKNKNECRICHTHNKPVNGILEITINNTATENMLRSNQIKVVFILLLALTALILIILRLFDKIINQPLSRLKDLMKRVQEGDLDRHLQPEKKDEIGELTESFNLMVEKLKDARAQIRSLHTQQIEKAGHLASLGTLAAGLAHEIKNPIAGIKGAIEIIRHKTADNDPNKEIFTEILSQTDRIHSIIQDLLTYARPREINFKPVDPHKFIQAAVKMAESQTQGKDIIIKFSGLEEKLLIPLDSDKIQMVILNLLINSIDAIEQCGEINITMGVVNNRNLNITISDDGKGIPTEILPKVFSPFFTTKKRGTGLGLSISQQILQKHKGIIKVHSQAGQGTTFSIHIPIDPRKIQND